MAIKTVKLEKVVNVELTKEQETSIETAFEAGLEENLKDNNTTLEEPRGKEIKEFLENNKELLALHTLEESLVAKMTEENLNMQNYEKVLDKDLVVGDLYVNKGNPSKIVFVKGTDISEYNILGKTYHVVKEFADTQSLSLAKKENNLLGRLGYETLEVLERGVNKQDPKARPLYVQYKGAAITTAADANVVPKILHLITILEFNKDIPATTIKLELSIKAAQMIMKKFEEKEKELQDKEKQN